MSAEIELQDYGTRAAWLTARSSSIGASESAALFGVSPWQTPVSLWALKTGKLKESVGGEWLEWGQLLEAPIAERYERVTGRRLWQGGPYAVARHPRIPIMTATPDRFVIEAHDRAGQGLLQIKNTNAFMGHDWDEGPPQHIQIQVQHEMAVTGRDWASVAVLVGGCEFRKFDVERNDAFIAELEEQCLWMWGFIERDEQPPVDGSPRTLEVIKKLHPLDNGEAVSLPPDAIDWWGQLEMAKAEEKSAKERKTDAEVRLKDAIGDATYGVLPDGRRLSLKTSSNPGHEAVVNPYTYRTLRLEKAAKGKKR